MAFEHFVALAQSIPCAVVLSIDVYSSAVRFDSGLRILELDVFMTHQSPRGLEIAIERQCATEVKDRLLVLGNERVVIAEDTIRLWPKLVSVGCCGCQSGQFRSIGQDIKQIAVNVHSIKTM